MHVAALVIVNGGRLKLWLGDHLWLIAVHHVADVIVGLSKVDESMLFLRGHVLKWATGVGKIVENMPLPRGHASLEKDPSPLNKPHGANDPSFVWAQSPG